MSRSGNRAVRETKSPAPEPRVLRRLEPIEEEASRERNWACEGHESVSL